VTHGCDSGWGGGGRELLRAPRREVSTHQPLHDGKPCARMWVSVCTVVCCLWVFMQLNRDAVLLRLSAPRLIAHAGVRFGAEVGAPPPHPLLMGPPPLSAHLHRVHAPLCARFFIRRHMLVHLPARTAVGCCAGLGVVWCGVVWCGVVW
jgi:hypothetical protein